MEGIFNDLIVPTLSLGTAGGITGSILAVARHKSIPVYATTTSLNCTIMGASFFSLRKMGHMLDSRAKTQPLRRTWTSAASGAVTGALFNAFIRGRTGLGTAILFYGSLGGAGEYLFIQGARLLDPSPLPLPLPQETKAVPRVKQSDKSVWRKLQESSPLRKIPDAEFESMMVGKIADLDEQIALVDEALASTRAELKA